MSVVRYGSVLINLRNVISVEVKNSTTLKFTYPLTNWFGGNWIYSSDPSYIYRINVDDAHRELDRIEKIMKDKD